MSGGGEGWQAESAALPERVRDVAVVGAGPAGSAAALSLARRGLDTVVLERARFPRDKACGDALIPDAIHCLRRLGLLDRVREIAHPARVARASSPSRIAFDLEAEFLVLPRLRLDELLARAAHEGGAEVAHGHVESVEDGEEGPARIRVRGREDPVEARAVIVATGGDVRLLQEMGSGVDARPAAYAARMYLRSPVRLEELLFAYDRSVTPGYAWIFPTAANGYYEYNVGVGVFLNGGDIAAFNLRELLAEFMEGFPEARALAADGEELSPLRGARIRCGLNPGAARPGQRVLAAGEAIDTTYPFSGEGIGKAMETGVAAAEAVAALVEVGDPSGLDAYPRRIQEELGPKYVGYRAAERWLARPWVGDLVARRACRSRFLREAAEGIIREEVDPRRVFSPGGLLRSLWS